MHPQKFTSAPTEGQTFYWSIYDSWWQHQMSVHALRHDRPSGRFSKSWGLSASVSLPFLPSPSPLLLLVPFFAWSVTLIPRSLLQNRTETLAISYKMPGIPCQREGWDRVKEGKKLLTILTEHLPLCRYKKNYTAFDFVSLFTGYQFYQKILIKKICLSNRKPCTFIRHWLTKLNQFTRFKIINFYILQVFVGGGDLQRY